MIWEIVILVVLGGAFVVLKVLHSENERKRRLERAELGHQLGKFVGAERRGHFIAASDYIGPFDRVPLIRG